MIDVTQSPYSGICPTCDEVRKWQVATIGPKIFVPAYTCRCSPEALVFFHETERFPSREAVAARLVAEGFTSRTIWTKTA